MQGDIEKITEQKQMSLFCGARLDRAVSCYYSIFLKVLKFKTDKKAFLQTFKRSLKN